MFIGLHLQSCDFIKTPKETWKLYKNSALDNSSYYLILDMQYFGSSIREEECSRLKEFYSKVNPARDFICRKKYASQNPIMK